MRISVVTPSFNQGPFLAEAIESVRRQGGDDVEHIIVDNCSTDNTKDVLSRYAHLKVICEKDQGQSDALNKGFKAAAGEVVGWLNADDRYLPGCFEHVISAFANDPRTDIIYGDYRLIDQQGRLIKVKRELSFDMFMLKYLHVLCIPSTTTFFRRRVFEEGNFLDIGYHYSMDYEYFLRLAGSGYRFHHIPQVTADFRWHMDAKSQKQTKKQKEEMEQALLRLDPLLGGMNPSFRPLVRQGLMLAARSKRCLLKLMTGAYGA